MFKVLRSMREVNFRELTRVYAQSIYEQGKEKYPHYTKDRMLLEAEQDLYLYLTEFFRDAKSFCAVWTPEGRYETALRCEPYADGVLVEGLETAFDSRGKGYAKSLVSSVLLHLQEQGYYTVYSHIGKSNIASQKVHLSCGFQKRSDSAVYIDGSADSRCGTYVIYLK